MENTNKTVISADLSKAKEAQLRNANVNLDKNPLVTNYPKFYNPKAHSIWADIVATLEPTFYKNTRRNWSNAIQGFQNACANAGIPCFDEDKLAEGNKRISDSLLSNRIQAIKACDEANLFATCKIKSVLHRVAIVEGNTFFVENTAKLKSSEDPTIQKWLMGSPIPGFTKISDKLYQKQVNAATTVTINFMRRDYTTISLKISCHSVPLVPNRKASQTLARYIESKIWDPLVDAYKFKGAENKKF